MKTRFNCWKILKIRTISSQASKDEGSTTRSKDRTPKWVEMGGTQSGSRYSLNYMVTYSSSSKNGISVTSLYEHCVMEELFVAPLHWGFVFFGWMALGVFGVVLQILGRIHALVGREGVALLTE